MATLNPYLNFDGNTEEAFNFYKSVFGGDFARFLRFKDTPEKDRTPAKDQEKIMHVSLPIGKENVLMGTDALESMGHKLNIGNNIQLSITAQTDEEGTRIFKALEAGGKTIVPLGKASWGGYFGMLTDKFGIQWMLSYEESKKEQSKEKERELAHH